VCAKNMKLARQCIPPGMIMRMAISSASLPRLALTCTTSIIIMNQIVDVVVAICYLSSVVALQPAGSKASSSSKTWCGTSGSNSCGAVVVVAVALCGHNC
jgi:hypothetical protein